MQAWVDSIDSMVVKHYSLELSVTVEFRKL